MTDKTMYLRDRLASLNHEIDKRLLSQFYIVDDEAPQSFKELQERMAKGLYIIDEKYLDKRSWNGLFNYVTWRDPAKPADTAGYAAASKQLDKAYTAAKDQIVVLEPADGLKALQAFEAWTPTSTQ